MAFFGPCPIKPPEIPIWYHHDYWLTITPSLHPMRFHPCSSPQLHHK
jgi:hypothetical protein